MKIKLTFSLLVILSVLMVIPMFVGANPQTDQTDYLQSVIPSYITNYTVFQGDPILFKRAAQSNTTVSLPFFNDTIELQPMERNLLANDFTALIVDENGKITETSIQRITTLQGFVKGDTESTIAITTTDEMIYGTIHYKHMAYTIESLNRYTDLDDFSNHHLLYPNNDLLLDIPTIGSKGIHSEIDETTGTIRTSSITRYLTCRIICACDLQFYNKVPWWALDMINVINGIDSIYADQIDTVMSITRTMAILSGCESTDSSTLLSQFQSKMIELDKSTYLPRDTAHLFSGKYFDEGVGGEAFQRALRTDRAYGVSSHFDQLGLPYPLFYRQMLVAHEVGHNFNGNHGFSDYWEIDGQYYKSIMTSKDQYWNVYPITPRFSDGTGILGQAFGGHNNTDLMRIYASYRLVDWSYNTIPGGKHCNFEVSEFYHGGKAYQVNTIGSSQYGYTFFGYTHSQTFRVRADGTLHFWGWFRQYDTFPVLQQAGRRRLFVYVLSLDTSVIVGSKQILDHNHGIIWHNIGDSIDGLTPGQEVRFGIGRPDSWDTDWHLTAEWASVTVFDQFSGRTDPVGKDFNFKLISTTWGDGYHIDTSGSLQHGYYFYGYTGQLFTVSAGDSIEISGYFRHEDTFTDDLAITRRKSYVYLLDASGYVLDSILLLDYDSGMSWIDKTKTFSNLYGGSYRIGIGRSDSWATDWQLTVEWVDITINVYS